MGTKDTVIKFHITQYLILLKHVLLHISLVSKTTK